MPAARRHSLTAKITNSSQSKVLISFTLLLFLFPLILCFSFIHPSSVDHLITFSSSFLSSTIFLSLSHPPHLPQFLSSPVSSLHHFFSLSSTLSIFFILLLFSFISSFSSFLYPLISSIIFSISFPPSLSEVTRSSQTNTDLFFSLNFFTSAKHFKYGKINSEEKLRLTET